MNGKPTPPRRAAPNLVANFLPVRFNGHGFMGDVVAFDPDRLASLRQELRGTHVVRRDGDRIVCVPVLPDAAEVGEREKFTIGEHRRLTMGLVKEALIREVIAMKYQLGGFRRPSFVSRYRQQDLLAQSAADLRDALDGLHVFPRYTLDTRASGPSSQPGIIIGLKTRYEIDLTVADLARRGVAVQGRYVLAQTGEVEFHPDLDEHVYRRLAGQIESIRDGRLYLRDAPVLSEVDADKAWLEGRRETLRDVVAALTGGRHGRVLDVLEEAIFELTGAEGRLNRISALAHRLVETGPLTIAPGLVAEVDLPIGGTSARRRDLRVTSTRFRSPSYVFDPGGDKTDRSAQNGLVEFGPFDSEFFTPRRPRILVLTPRAFQGTVEVFMDQFRRGVPNGKVFKQGFVRKYRLTDCDVVIEPFDAGPRDAVAYRAACLAAAQNGKPSLAIVVTSEEQQDLQGDASPYLVAKSTLMGQGIPVQEVQVETIRRGDLDSPLDSIALQCYAKLGGIPYVIAAPRPIAHELVIGIGSSHINPSRFGTPERVVGAFTSRPDLDDLDRLVVGDAIREPPGVAPDHHLPEGGQVAAQRVAGCRVPCE